MRKNYLLLCFLALILCCSSVASAQGLIMPCCFSDGTCYEEDEMYCLSMGGNPVADCYECYGMGEPCCFPDGTYSCTAPGIPVSGCNGRIFPNLLPVSLAFPSRPPLLPASIPDSRDVFYLIIGKDRTVPAYHELTQHTVAAFPDAAAHILFHG